jgi:tRNA threonylcarbamoyladenosine biosynthesis protein TsaB
MNVLALDTSAEACSVALSVDGRLFSGYQVAPRKHADLVLPMVSDLLAEAGVPLSVIRVFAFGRGPGAFTGLRIAAGMVQGLATGVGGQVVPVSTLAAMAHRGWRDTGRTHVHAAIDARMGEIYWGSFEILGEGRMRSLGPERVIKPADVASLCSDEFTLDPASVLGVGTGWRLLAPQMPSHCFPSVLDPELLPDARDVLALALSCATRGETCEPGLAQPVYLRDDVVQVRNVQG